jgi:hypothetical protein
VAIKPQNRLWAAPHPTLTLIIPLSTLPRKHWSEKSEKNKEKKDNDYRADGVACAFAGADGHAGGASGGRDAARKDYTGPGDACAPC